MEKSGGPSCESGVAGRLENSAPKTDTLLRNINYSIHLLVILL